MEVTSHFLKRRRTKNASNVRAVFELNFLPNVFKWQLGVKAWKQLITISSQGTHRRGRSSENFLMFCKMILDYENYEETLREDQLRRWEHSSWLYRSIWVRNFLQNIQHIKTHLDFASMAWPLNTFSSKKQSNFNHLKRYVVREKCTFWLENCIFGVKESLVKDFACVKKWQMSRRDVGVLRHVLLPLFVINMCNTCPVQLFQFNSGLERTQIISVCSEISEFFQFYITDICQTSESFVKSVNLK